MTYPLNALKAALADGPNPLCIESFTGTNSSGQLRSSNSTYMVPLTYEGVGELIVLIKSLAALDTGDPPRAQSGTFSLDGHSCRVNCCPQPDGEILIVHHSGTNAAAAEDLPLEAALRVALDRDEFRLHYQPKVDIRTGEVMALEALIRWERPGLGLVPPAKFIAAAEETGLIVPIGNWVLRAACAQNKEWQDQGLPRVRVAVNLSPAQLIRREFTRNVQSVLTETGLEHEYLELELTESTILSDAELASASCGRYIARACRSPLTISALATRASVT